MELEYSICIQTTDDHSFPFGQRGGFLQNSMMGTLYYIIQAIRPRSGHEYFQIKSKFMEEKNILYGWFMSMELKGVP